MTIDAFISQLKTQPEQCVFSDTMSVIANNYHYKAAGFQNGALYNQAGSNEGSCKLFAFAQLHNLSKKETLQCFGDYFRIDVLGHPDGEDHQNIRNFMLQGWEGIRFEEMPLTRK